MTREGSPTHAMGGASNVAFAQPVAQLTRWDARPVHAPRDPQSTSTGTAEPSGLE